ncbi:histidine phosphotransferase family protein [Limimaricola hongkongensis]|uniref:Signal transduction histidine kinase n=1 Tax=Limimaricola hongkongensis DSM 17492 TaxID=1122180 RepID=A0A017HB36_9RHOB|nr:histidine phosphotransferase family protein [Limimaricola hongkongensis]EYD71717.1 Signal transduction histidine kinase [Limimaricola hongkongensis DSM 17492]
MNDQPDLGALIVSRICHDLISPLSAIGNGVELLEMTTPPGPELSLISESVENAVARIRFFRFAFGAASADQLVGRSEIVSMLDALSRSGRLRYDWEVAEDVPRDRLKLAMLLAACTEQALPQGGRIVFAGQADALRLSAHGPKVRPDPDAWERLRHGTVSPQAKAGEAQFAIAAAMLRLSARPLWIETGEHGVEIGF